MGLCLSVRLSVTSRCSVETAERIELVFLAGELPSTRPTLREKEIPFSPKIRALPSGILSHTLELENFATAYRSSKRVINLTQKGGRPERDKLGRRRSTKSIIPPSSDARPL